MWTDLSNSFEEGWAQYQGYFCLQKCINSVILLVATLYKSAKAISSWKEYFFKGTRIERIERNKSVDELVESLVVSRRALSLEGDINWYDWSLHSSTNKGNTLRVPSLFRYVLFVNHFYD